MILQTAHISQTVLLPDSGKIGFGDIVTRGLDDEDRLRRFVNRPLQLELDPQYICKTAPRRHHASSSKSMTPSARRTYQSVDVYLKTVWASTQPKFCILRQQ